MICSIYKSLKKQGSYIYLKKNSSTGDDFSKLPEALLKIMGKLELAMQLNINDSTKLAQAEVVDVLSEIENKGYYLQLPNHDFDLRIK